MSTKHRASDKGGVYCLLNLITGERYIGSSKNLRLRREKVFCKLRAGTAHNLALQASFRLHGESAFQWLVLEEAAEDRRLDAEQRWIEAFPPEALFNAHLNSRSPMGRKPHGQRMRFLLSERGRGKSPSAETRQKISAALRGASPTPAQIAFRQRLATMNRGKKRTPAMIEKYRAAARMRTVRGKPFRLISPDGSIQAGENLKEFARTVGLDYTSLRLVQAGKKSEFKGWRHFVLAN